MIIHVDCDILCLSLLQVYAIPSFSTALEHKEEFQFIGQIASCIQLKLLLQGSEKAFL